jgi:hypothetical protein
MASAAAAAYEKTDPEKALKYARIAAASYQKSKGEDRDLLPMGSGMGSYTAVARILDSSADPKDKALLESSKNHDCSSVAQILVVSDEASCSYTTFESGFLQQTLQPAQVQLAKLGAPEREVVCVTGDGAAPSSARRSARSCA